MAMHIAEYVHRPCQQISGGVQAFAVVFLIPKDEPVDMRTDPRYAVLRSLQSESPVLPFWNDYIILKHIYMC
jgi:hypothetical protein